MSVVDRNVALQEKLKSWPLIGRAKIISTNERSFALASQPLKGYIFLAKDLYNYVIIQLCIYIALNEYKFLMESESKKYYWFIGFLSEREIIYVTK